MKATNRFRVIVDTPWMSKGGVIVNHTDIECDKYPHLFARLYEFPSGELVVFGDSVWRIDGNKDAVKKVGFHTAHLTGEIELFPNKELAEKALELKIEKQQKKYKDFALIDYLANIKSYSEIDLEESSPKKVKLIMSDINNCAKELINYFNKL